MIKTITAYVVCCDACGKESGPHCPDPTQTQRFGQLLAKKCQWTQPPTDDTIHWCPACSAKIFAEEGKP